MLEVPQTSDNSIFGHRIWSTELKQYRQTLSCFRQNRVQLLNSHRFGTLTAWLYYFMISLIYSFLREVSETGNICELFLSDFYGDKREIIILTSCCSEL